MNEAIQLAGIAWYEASDYPEIRALMVDRRRLPSTHTRWQVGAVAIEERLAAEGDVVYRALLRPDEFRLFCAQHDLPPNAAGRGEFAMRAAMRAHRGARTVALYRSSA